MLGEGRRMFYPLCPNRGKWGSRSNARYIYGKLQVFIYQLITRVKNDASHHVC
jgi:hypothetical protein